MSNLIFAIDFEGSHKNPRVGCPIQIGLALMAGESVLESWESLIQPPRHYKTGRPTREADAYALQVSGLTLDELDSAPASRQVCHLLSKVIEDWENKHRFEADDIPNVAFNIGYDFDSYCDLLFQGGEYDRHLAEYVGYKPILGSQWICASQMARRTIDAYSIRSYSLDDVASYFGMERSTDKHGALEDAILAGQAYNRLVIRKGATVG